MQGAHIQSHLLMLLFTKIKSVATASAASGVYIERCLGSILAGDR